MTAIISPKPRPAYSSLTTSPPHSLLAPIYAQDDDQRALHSPPRLASPIDLFDPRANDANIVKSPSTCKPVKRRRGPTSYALRSSRRRPYSRADCHIIPFRGPAVFDSLPWIAQLEAAPEDGSVLDIADLSQLATKVTRPESPCMDLVRRRKKPLRPHRREPEPIRSADCFPPPGLESLPAYALFPADRFVSNPRTPPPRESFVPSEVRFHGLNPAFPSGLDDVWYHPCNSPSE
ncbi:uncharacterized protein LAESUDRAFT_507485 [Laetiporus sulphureus 93-53]|uniref:Uncharacterized protein n=1 Tax=Laetiporus sulphureus 93-53 TaxID=1314785 RepID=A0A165FWA6_9APHY|nr:uncharacterized protein LAESUDRAFT_507485 [Laetiporus sulphureus 93-53]KZT09495.1 hypothetical protein LAESUDRAFT_507485 [Laetiporus sulphureus 93-53]